LENGKYGDQKYLDYFADKFENVYDIENRGTGIAYWNMNDYKYADCQVTYKKQQWPIVFFHYSGFNVAVESDELVFRHSMYLTSTIKKTFVIPYAELMKDIFTKYLNAPINRVKITPLEYGKYMVKSVLFCLSKVLPIEWCVAQVMKLKYRERKSPYSER
jgi:hypothetical protein